MSVTNYEARYSKLSRHALIILPTDAERVQRFVAGLHSGIQATMAREVEMGNSVVVDWIYWSYVVTFCGYETRADLLLLDMTEFEVILGMDSLSPYHSILDCHAKIVTLAMPELPRLEWRGSSVSTSSRVISFLKDRHMVEKGCLAYLAYVQDTTTETSAIDSVPVVREFSDVFPSDLPGMPPDRNIDFCIDLDPGTQHISIPLYHMSPKELKNLKE
ncbi:uncharacterized protein [Nicotiana sylvestris]|uniref:uncharacterized protein n=1 Tax=Nicotiana sylvestris TaxID=4096 RepID=UPI00388CE3FE